MAPPPTGAAVTWWRVSGARVVGVDAAAGPRRRGQRGCRTVEVARRAVAGGTGRALSALRRDDLGIVKNFIELPETRGLIIVAPISRKPNDATMGYRSQG
jgi:hypothetical protein